MNRDPRHMSELIRQGPLAELVREVERRKTETARVRALLPAEEAAHVVSATTNESGELVLVMDTPAWAARARYAVSALPHARVKVRVVPRAG
jgi:hypothetical protein